MIFWGRKPNAWISHPFWLENVWFHLYLKTIAKQTQQIKTNPIFQDFPLQNHHWCPTFPPWCHVMFKQWFTSSKLTLHRISSIIPILKWTLVSGNVIQPRTSFFCCIFLLKLNVMWFVTVSCWVYAAILFSQITRKRNLRLKILI